MKFTQMNEKLSLLVVPVLLIIGGTLAGKRHTRESDGQLSEMQKRYLEKIQLLAREGGLPDEEWQSITKFDSNVCYEIDCLESALEIMTATNFTVDPCNQEAWLDFVCARRVNGPDNKNQFELLTEVVDLQTKKLLEDNSGNLVDEFLFKEAQTYYYQCIHKGRDDDKDVKTILEYLSQNYGPWPILTNRDPGETFQWSDMVADLNRISRPGFKPSIFQVSIPKSGNKIKLDIGQTNFITSGADYNGMLKKVQRHSGSNRPYRSEQLQGMGIFLNSLNYATMQSTKLKRMTLEKLDNKTFQYFSKRNGSLPIIDWLDFFERVFDGTDIEISPNTVVALPFINVMQILQSIQNSTKRDVANALNFQFASQLLMESTVLLDDLNTFKCTELSTPREVVCLETIKEIFGYSLGTTYLNVYYDDAVNTPAIKALMAKIQLGYLDVIDDSAWMQNSTKVFVKDKIADITTFITKPDWLKQPGALENFFSGLLASNNKSCSYPMNFLSINDWFVTKKRSHDYKMARVQESGDFSDLHIYDLTWNRYLGTAQAQFHKMINQGRVEGGLVQKPIFGVNRPGFMNFGGLGMVLSHEVGHSFDLQGIHFDKHGKLGDHWDKDSFKMYKEWVKTIAHDSGSIEYQISETSAETLDPSKTINEDIADVLAVLISYFSYQEYLKELENFGMQEKLLPGLKTFTPQKLFFMKYANMWCNNKDIQSVYADMQKEHSIGNTRATLPLKRSKQFAEAFGCEIPKQF